jgi:hypothetical protein
MESFMIKQIRIYIFTFLFLITIPVFAKDLTFGAEFTFTNQNILKASKNAGSIVNIPEAVEAAKAFRNEVVRRCNGCSVATETNGYGVEVYKIIYPDGWYFVIATDPAVVEVQTKPSTIQTVRSLQARMQTDIFDAAKAVGIVPDTSTGGGHIHFDYKASTDGNLLRLRNFVVDFANHPELAQGLWAFDFHNSGPIAALPLTQRNAFEQLIADVDSGVVKTAFQFVTRLRKEVYNYHRHGWAPADKYHALNVNRINDRNFPEEAKTLEVRSIRPQKSAAEFLALIEVIDGRLELNKTRKTSLELKLSQVDYYQGFDSKAFQKHLKYIGEAGVEPRDYAFKYQRSLPEGWAQAFSTAQVHVTRFCSRIFGP